MKEGETLGHYRILAKLGEGGMGEVYRARDTRLGRDVALKVLPAGVASDADRLARFEREARALASLNHANIAAIFGLEDVPSAGSGQEGQTALVMELVEGPTLADRIAEGPISLDEALSIATQIAEALEAAHAQGIVHRDLKPANVMIRRDRCVKVLDFGLAKVARSRQDEDALTAIGETQAGVILGTPAYMSPEQIAGSQVDHRTDIFSLGIILYEMVTGHRPFQGKTQMELAASIMRDQPLRISRPDAPDRVVAAIEQCLVKSAGDRMQSAGSLASRLRGITLASTSVAGERSKDEGFWVAVLPFKSTGASPELAALAEGLTEEIAAGLSRFSYFRVLTKGLSGARYVIEGSLRQSGGQLRVAVKLIDTSTGANAWAENYTRSWSPDTVFETQDSLVPTIVSTIAESNGVLAHSMWVGLRDHDPTTLSPYEALLRSFGYNEHLSPDEHRLARVGLKRAIEQQPNHAGCLAMLAIVCADGYLLGYGTEENQAEQAVAYGRRAVAAEPSDHFTHYALAFAHMSRKDVPAFHRAAERALALNPLDGGAMAGIAMFTAFLGEWQRGCALMQRAMALNPRHPGWYWFPFVADAYRRKEYSQALDHALRLNLPGFFHTLVWFAAVHGQLGNRAEAAQALRELDALYPDFDSRAKHELGKWFAESALVEHLLEGLRKAGLAITEGSPAAEGQRRVGLTREPDATIVKAPPVPATPLIGREETLDQAAARLSEGVRLLTVSGYGGTGKTRFAIEIFRRLAPEYPGGAAFVSLASVTAATDVLPTVAATLAIPEAQGRSALEALATVIGDRRVLLVLDNLEQVLDAAGDIAALLSRCPALQCLATSRAPLKIGAETEFSLPPLELPPPDATSLEAIGRCPAVALFVQRARKVKPGFALTAVNAAVIADICRRLDGLPLAIELAAARTRILEPAALLRRLDQALDLLTSGDRDLPLRQRTLRATISWSYSLLDDSEQGLLRRLSCFHDGWTLEAMEQACYPPEERHRALDALDSLVEKGLVRVVVTSGRYALLETIRAFAAEQLHAAGEVDATRQAHADYFTDFAAGVAAALRTTNQIEAMQRALADDANTHAAIEWLIAGAVAGDADALEQGLLLCGHLGWVWHLNGQHVTARVALDQLLALAANRSASHGRALASLAAGMVSTTTDEWERSLSEWRRGFEDGEAVGDAEAAAEGLMGMGYCYLSMGQMADAEAALDDAIARSRGVSDFLLALSMTLKGMLLVATGNLDAGMTLVHDARPIQERIGDREGGGLALSFLAQMTFAKGDPTGALALYADALASFEAVGDRPEKARVLCETGWTALAAADSRAAMRAFRRAVQAYEEVGSPRGTGLALLGIAACEAADGRSERAVTIAAAAHALSARAGVVVEHPMDPGVVERIEAVKASIPEGTLEGIVAEASTLTPAAVLAMVAEPDDSGTTQEPAGR